MADDVDLTADRLEKEVAGQIANSRRPEGPTPTGQCLYCREEMIISTQRWCNADCRDEWEYERSRGLR